MFCRSGLGIPRLSAVPSFKETFFLVKAGGTPALPGEVELAQYVLPIWSWNTTIECSAFLQRNFFLGKSRRDACAPGRGRTSSVCFADLVLEYHEFTVPMSMGLNNIKMQFVYGNE